MITAALLPDWFTTKFALLGPILGIVFFVSNQPKSWFMMAFILLVELVWYLSVLSWLQRLTAGAAKTDSKCRVVVPQCNLTLLLVG